MRDAFDVQDFHFSLSYHEQQEQHHLCWNEFTTIHIESFMVTVRARDLTNYLVPAIVARPSALFCVALSDRKIACAINPSQRDDFILCIYLYVVLVCARIQVTQHKSTQAHG